MGIFFSIFLLYILTFSLQVNHENARRTWGVGGARCRKSMIRRLNTKGWPRPCHMLFYLYTGVWQVAAHLQRTGSFSSSYVSANFMATLEILCNEHRCEDFQTTTAPYFIVNNCQLCPFSKSCYIPLLTVPVNMIYWKCTAGEGVHVTFERAPRMGHYMEHSLGVKTAWQKWNSGSEKEQEKVEMSCYCPHKAPLYDVDTKRLLVFSWKLL